MKKNISKNTRLLNTSALFVNNNWELCQPLSRAGFTAEKKHFLHRGENICFCCKQYLSLLCILLRVNVFCSQCHDEIIATCKLLVIELPLQVCNSSQQDLLPLVLFNSFLFWFLVQSGVKLVHRLQRRVHSSSCRREY